MVPYGAFLVGADALSWYLVPEASHHAALVGVQGVISTLDCTGMQLSKSVASPTPKVDIWPLDSSLGS